MKKYTYFITTLKTLGAVTQKKHTHGLTINEIKKDKSRDRKVFCCFCDMQKW